MKEETNQNPSPKVCWITASYFLDVDLPVVPKLKEYFNIDWIIITSSKSKESDVNYIKSKTDKKYEIVVNDHSFYSFKLFKFYKKLIKKIRSTNYDWFYFDISDYFFLFPLIKYHLGNTNVTFAFHNVNVPKGARLPFLAKLSNSFLRTNFSNFQVFSKNQQRLLQKESSKANIFYCPLMLKDYGNKVERRNSKSTRFLFFGNIIQYKRLDILLQAVNFLVEQGIHEFKVSICGYCKPEVWQTTYQPLIKYPKYVFCDIRRIPNELVGTYFSMNDYFVMPYQDIAQSGAMTVALNYNMPVIASELDTFKEFITHEVNGYLFEQGSIESLAYAMRWAINNNQERYNELKHNLKKMVDENLSEKIIIDKYKQYLKKCLNA